KGVAAMTEAINGVDVCVPNDVNSHNIKLRKGIGSLRAFGPPFAIALRAIGGPAPRVRGLTFGQTCPGFAGVAGASRSAWEPLRFAPAAPRVELSSMY
ncbi:hypothetical protein, partial [Kitasatospora sp. NPDC050463]|uniref:hypothetical protein n=1 Tax=Kitasatospora sp. NPDC050463 TaxID=3155786 RepID=UPI0033FCF40C